MDFKQRQTRFIMASVIVLATILVVGCVIWLLSRSTIKPTDGEQLGNTAQSSDAIIVATDITGDSSLSDINDRENTYSLTSIDSLTLSKDKIGEIRASIFSHSLAVNQSNELFYINADGQLVIHRIDTGFSTIVPVPGIKPVFGFFGDTSMKDFVLSGDTVVYFQGGCADGARCDLKSYDLKTKKSTTILAHLEKKLTIVGETMIDLVSYDPARKTTTLRKTRNTAANGYADIIEVDAKGVNTIIKTIEFTADSEKTPEAENIFTKKLSCGGSTVSQKLGSGTRADDISMQTIITNKNGKSVTHSSTYIVGCVMVQ